MPVQNVNPGLTLVHQKDLAEHYVNVFNQANPPGSTVWWWSTACLGPVYETKVESHAFVNVIGDQADAHVCLVGVVGSVPVVRCQKPNEQRRDQIKPVCLEYVPAAMVAQGQRISCYATEHVKAWHNYLLPGFGSREHLKSAAVLLRQAADCLEAAYAELGEDI